MLSSKYIYQSNRYTKLQLQKLKLFASTTTHINSKRYASTLMNTRRKSQAVLDMNQETDDVNTSSSSILNPNYNTDGVIAGEFEKPLQHRAWAPSNESLPPTLQSPNNNFPLLYEIKERKNRSLQYLSDEVKKLISDNLHVYGAVLLRPESKDSPDNFINSPQDFDNMTNLTGYKKFSTYAGGAALREKVDEKTDVFSASDELAEITMDPHQELSYQPVFPSLFFMYCEKAADCGGGESGVTNMRKVSEELFSKHPTLIQKLEKQGIRYVFNMCAEAGQGYYSWKQQLAATKEEAEATMKERNYSWKWQGDELTFWYELPATTFHEKTGEKIFFNQFAQLHESYFWYHPDWVDSAGTNNHRVTTSECNKKEGSWGWSNPKFNINPKTPPFNVTYGNGEQVSVEDIELIRNIMWKHTSVFQLQKGDILVLDNLLVGHSRLGWNPDFKRKLFVSLAEPKTWVPNINSENKKMENIFSCYGFVMIDMSESKGFTKADNVSLYLDQLVDNNGLILLRNGNIDKNEFSSKVQHVLLGDYKRKNYNKNMFARHTVVFCKQDCTISLKVKKSTTPENDKINNIDIENLVSHPEPNYSHILVEKPNMKNTTNKSENNDTYIELKQNDVVLVDNFLVDIPSLGSCQFFENDLFQVYSGNYIELDKMNKVTGKCDKDFYQPYEDPESEMNALERDIMLKHDLAYAHRLLAKYSLDELVWNHCSARSYCNNTRFFVTSGERMFENITFSDLVTNDNTKNKTANVIHSAVYKARPDINAVVHTHSPSIVAVSCLKNGLKMFDQRAGAHYQKIAYYNWKGISDSSDECQEIMKAISNSKIQTVILKNHGALTMGKTVKEAWVNMFYLDKLCQTYLALIGAQDLIDNPSHNLMVENSGYFNMPQYAPGNKEWNPLKDSIKHTM